MDQNSITGPGFDLETDALCEGSCVHTERERWGWGAGMVESSGSYDHPACLWASWTRVFCCLGLNFIIPRMKLDWQDAMSPF